jgi:hypothetical protein
MRFNTSQIAILIRRLAINSELDASELDAPLLFFTAISAIIQLHEFHVLNDVK